MLQEFPSDQQLTIQDPWSQIQIDTKMWVKYTCIPEWSNTETAKNWVCDNILDQAWANIVRCAMEEEIMELKQGWDHFDETLFDNYEVLQRTHAMENALPITVQDLLGESIDVQNSNHPSPTLALTPGQNSDSGPVTYQNSTQNSGTKKIFGGR